MSADPVGSWSDSPVPMLPPEATPAAIRDALVDDERADFERAYREAMSEAATSMDLTRVLDVLRGYHRIAELTHRQGAAAHRRMLDKASHILATGENPNGVAVDEVRGLIERRLAR